MTSDIKSYVKERNHQIARNVYLLRRRNKWSQGRVAEYLQCSLRRVQGIEKGQSRFYLGELERLAEAFQVSFEEIISPTTTFTHLP